LANTADQKHMKSRINVHHSSSPCEMAWGLGSLPQQNLLLEWKRTRASTRCQVRGALHPRPLLQPQSTACTFDLVQALFLAPREAIIPLPECSENGTLSDKDMHTPWYIESTQRSKNHSLLAPTVTDRIWRVAHACACARVLPGLKPEVHSVRLSCIMVFETVEKSFSQSLNAGGRNVRESPVRLRPQT